MKKRLLFLFAFLFAACCTWSQNNYEIEELEFGTKFKDIDYGRYFQNSGDMDVYLTYNAHPRQPFVILIHGGAFMEGDKKDMQSVAEELMKNGINSVAINYKLLPRKYFKDKNTTYYNDMLTDIWNAIQHIQLKSEEWSVRRTGYTLLGEEAGGYLALLAGYKFYQEVESIVAIGAITDLRDLRAFNRLSPRKNQEKILFTKLMGGEAFRSTGQLSNNYTNGNPIDQVRSVPTYLVHGVRDVVIPYSQSAKLYTFLRDINYPSEIYTLEAAGHRALHDPNYNLTITSKIVDWITK